jgi:(p)ppGpp synthase/HD superfamily hydrolase
MLDVNGNILIVSAAVYAAEAHAGQVRKELNEPYIVHPLRIGKMAAQLGQTPEFIAAAYLHDVAEDTTRTLSQMQTFFPSPTMELVRAVTKWWQTSDHSAQTVAANKAAYYAQILAQPGAPLLKVLDRVDNLYDFAKMARQTPKSHKWAAKYFKKTNEEFVDILAALDIRSDMASREARKYYDAALSALEVAL